MSKQAFVMLVMNVSKNYKPDRYVPGALVLAHALRKYRTRHDLVLMHDGTLVNESIEALGLVYDRLVFVNYIIDEATKPFRTSKQQAVYSPWISYSYTKWNCLGLIEYDRVCFLDVDNVPLNNIDELLDSPDLAPAACFKPFKMHINDYFGKLPEVLGMPVPNNLIIRALTSNGNTLGGNLVVLPTGHLRDYINYITSGKYRAEKYNAVSGADEISITSFMLQLGKSWKYIPINYSIVPWKTPVNAKTKLITYTGTQKPWEVSRNEWPDMIHFTTLVDELVKKHPTMIHYFPQA